MHEGEGYRPETGMANRRGLPSLDFRLKVRAIFIAIRQMLFTFPHIPSIKTQWAGPLSND